MEKKEEEEMEGAKSNFASTTFILELFHFIRPTLKLSEQVYFFILHNIHSS